MDVELRWSEWRPLVPGWREAPRLPGVYEARLGASGPTVYVGRAGERRGQGLRGRLGVYGRGRAPHSGLGEHALNRKLADVDFLRARLAEAAAGSAATVGQWSVLALEGFDIHVRWMPTDDYERVEDLVIAGHDPAVLWNR